MNRTTAHRIAPTVLLTIAALVVAAAALASSSAGSQVRLRKTSLGSILVNTKGRTLYLFMKDKPGKSSCSGACAANWPPYLTTGRPTAGPGIKASLLGTTKRSDGKLQVTYARHPLYMFKFDAGPGSTRGENVEAFGAEWYVLSANGVKVEPKPKTTTTTTTTTGGGYG